MKKRISVFQVGLFLFLGVSIYAEDANDDDGFYLGACTHYAQMWELCDISLPLAARAGFDSIRDELTWSNVEKEKGRLVLPEYYEKFMKNSIALGLKPLMVLDYSNKNYDDNGYPKSDEAQEAFCRYAEFIARKYKYKGALFEIWNEWDNGCGMKGSHGGSPQVYAKLLKKVYPRLKAVNPECVVLGGAISGPGVGEKEGFVRRLLKQNVLPFMDGFIIHPYTYGSACETYFNSFPGVVDRFEELLKKHNKGVAKAIYITEMGWSTSRIENDLNRQSAYLARFLLLAKTRPVIKGVWIYNFTDCVSYEGHWWTPGEAQRNFGIIRQDYTPKPAYWMIRDLSGLIRNGEYAGRINLGHSDIFALKFKSHGKNTLALWTTKPRGIWRVMFRRNSADNPPLLYGKPGRGAGIPMKWNKNLFSVYADETPALLSGDISGLSVYNVQWIPDSKKTKKRSAILWNGNQPYALVEKNDAIKIDGDFSDWKNVPRMPMTPRSLSANSKIPKGFGGEVSFAWRGKHLHILIKVRDEKHNQPFDGTAIWEGDSVQLGLAAPCSNKNDYFEIGFARCENGIERAFWHVPKKLMNKRGEVETALKKVDVVINHVNGETFYELGIPSDAGLIPKLKRGGELRLSIVVNNNDDGARTGFLTWGAGIATEKNPDKFGKLILIDKQ